MEEKDISEFKAVLDGLNLSFDTKKLMEFGVPTTYFELPAGLEHYRLLRMVSSTIRNSLIVEIGALYGASNVALNANGNEVVSFDLRWQGTFPKIEECYNSKFIIDDVLKGKYIGMLLAASFIFVDTDHTGVFERKLYDHLVSIGYKGAVIWDDIFLNQEMIAFWDSLSDKEDLTPIGHITGTGLTTFR